MHGKHIVINKRDSIQAALIFLFIFPLFFQLSGLFFVDPAGSVYDSQGRLSLLPLPIASIFCFIGLAFLLHLEKIYFSMGVIVSMFALMIISTFFSAGAISKTELGSLLLLVQFILPMFAIVFGCLYSAPKSGFLKVESVILYMLLLVIPFEVIATILQETTLLSPYLYIFSLYQHLQYLPVIFVGLYFFSANGVYEKKILRYFVLFLAPWMGLYIAASLSFLAVIFAGLGTLISMYFLVKRRKVWLALSFALLLWVPFASYIPTIITTGTYKQKVSTSLSTKQDKEILQMLLASLPRDSYVSKFIVQMPRNLQHRFGYWYFYGNKVVESPEIFLFGRQTRPDRIKYPSAHNYYLDLVYHFGFMAILPFIYLVFVTMRKCWRIIHAGLLTPPLATLMLLVGFFVFVDNSLKVGFRQPYPGMIMFFLWGVLLSRLQEVKTSNC